MAGTGKKRLGLGLSVTTADRCLLRVKCVVVSGHTLYVHEGPIQRTGWVLSDWTTGTKMASWLRLPEILSSESVRQGRQALGAGVAVPECSAL